MSVPPASAGGFIRRACQKPARQQGLLNRDASTSFPKVRAFAGARNILDHVKLGPADSNVPEERGTSPTEGALEQIVAGALFWSALTCQRFVKRRLVAASGRLVQMAGDRLAVFATVGRSDNN